MNVEEIFTKIFARQRQTLILHGQWAVMFDFVGLNGFKAMQEYYYVCGNQAMWRAQKWYIRQYGKLIPENEVNLPCVTKAVPRNIPQIVEQICTAHIRWTEQTIEFLSAYAKKLHELSAFNDLMLVQNMIKDVAEELKKAKVLCLALSAVEWDTNHIQKIQKDFRKKYKKKLK